MKNPKDLYQGKKILILGLGVNQGGVGATKFFAGLGAKVKVTDLKNKEDLSASLKELVDYVEVEYTLGEHKYEDIDWADLIIKNHAIKPDNPYLLYALEAGKKVETDMGIFLEFVNIAQMIGITGTKGKSTTSTLIYEILKKAEKKVVFAGNIGKSVLDTLSLISDDNLIVLELSSFQLEAFKNHQVAPHIAVITNIYPDHLNYYPTLEKYIEAKKEIAREQTLEDFLFLKKGDKILESSDFQKELDSQINYFSPSDLPSDFKPKLQGEYNLWNMAASLAVVKTFDVDDKLALEVMQDFQGVEFRLQLIKKLPGDKNL